MCRPCVLFGSIAALVSLAVNARVDARQQLAYPAVTILLTQSSDAALALKEDEALKRADEALALAESLGDRVGVAMSYRMRGQVLRAMNRLPESEESYRNALSRFESLGNQAAMADVLSGLVVNAHQRNDQKARRELADRALQLYTAAGNDRGRAKLLRILVWTDAYRDVEDKWIEEIIEIGTRRGEADVLGDGLLARANNEFGAGKFAEAKVSFEQAIAALEQGKDLDTLAAAYLSLGRVYRAHGDYHGSIARYQKAIDLLQPTRERYTIVEAYNAKAIALGNLGRHDEAIAAYERGLALARESGNPRVIDFMEGNLAGGYASAGQYERAIPALEAIIARKPERALLGYRLNTLAKSLASVGRVQEAIWPSQEAIGIARELKQPDLLAGRLDDHSWILIRAARFEEALAASRESLDLTEAVRGRLVPSDFLKRGYADRVQTGYARGILILSEMSRAEEAFAVSEQSRARAFLDLMTARESEPELAARGQSTATAALARQADLASESLGQPLAASEIRSIAGRLNTTVVSYWVNDDTTLIWISKAGDDGPTMTKVPVPRSRIEALVAATTAALRQDDSGARTRGADAAELAALPMRGLGIMALSRDDKAAWRELHRLLIEPVRAQLPARGGRVTIIPHGALFQLSFAGLLSTRGRYLIEDYELHYAPAASVLAFTGRRQQAIAANAGGPWAVVGNPLALPTVGRQTLAPLPGAAREIAAIAALAPAGKALRLEGAAADEASLADTLDGKAPAVLHFATHGFVFDDAKEAPFLALHHRSGAADDGRLTLDEIYRLRLRTDLVVLSACRTGSGKISSDGIVGLTRGFFYAGTPSVVATFWDVADETAARLMPAFYRGYAKTGEKSVNLRAAQLALIADLRAGRVAVTASGRRITLPEHPLLWAGFFLTGEP